jgi:hypothetical protein
MQIECVAVVSAELDLDRIEETILDVDPDGRGELVLHEERAYEPSADGPGARGFESRKIDAVVSEVRREITRSVGRFAEVRASVVLFDRLVQGSDGTWSYDRSLADDQEQLDGYRQLAARALGIDETAAKDAIEIQYLPSPWATPPGAVEPRRGPGPAGYAALAVVAFAAAALVLGVVRTTRRPAPAAAPPAAAPPEAPPSPVPPGEALRREVADAVAGDLDRAASVLRRWIAKEG